MMDRRRDCSECILDEKIKRFDRTIIGYIVNILISILTTLLVLKAIG